MGRRSAGSGAASRLGARPPQCSGNHHAGGRELIHRARADFESALAVLVADLTPAERRQLSATASLVAVADARLRGIDILNWSPAGG